MSHRKEYQKQVIAYLEANDLPYNKDIVKSIMSKVAINSRNKYGCVDFEEEMGESGIENAKGFYKEYGKQDTYNRRISKLK